jgi:hypothetical protein
MDKTNAWGGRGATPGDGPGRLAPWEEHEQRLGRPGRRLGSRWRVACRGPAAVWGAGSGGYGRRHNSTRNLISSKASTRTTNRYVYNGIAGNFVDKLAPTAKKSTSRAAVTIELEKSYFFGRTLIKVYPFGWYLGFSKSKSKF